MRFYYGHYGQPLQTLQKQGLRSINYNIYYGHYCGQPYNSSNELTVYVED